MAGVRRTVRRAWVQRLGRFLASGLAVQAVYTAVFALTLLAAGLPRQAALAISYAFALAVHFVLNRRWVFAPDPGHEHSLRLSAQGVRYCVLAAVVYVVTAAGLEVLPGVIGTSPFVAWLLIAAAVGASNFFVLGRFVFRGAAPQGD